MQNRVKQKSHKYYFVFHPRLYMRKFKEKNVNVPQIINRPNVSQNMMVAPGILFNSNLFYLDLLDCRII